MLINAEELLEYDSGEKDFIHEIVVPIDPEGRRKEKYKPLQELVELSFVMAGVKLRRKPSNAFMIKVSPSSSLLLGCDGVLPNLSLNFKNLLEEGSPFERDMGISAIICKRNDHFVAFVRSGQDETSPWLFMNSDPDESIPKVEVLKNLSEEIEWCLDEAKKSGGDVTTEEPKCDGFRLFADAYMFIYV